MVAKLEMKDPMDLSQRLNSLREHLCHHPYFAGVPSFDPRHKTAAAFHAKDDLPEVRFQVLDLLVSEGDRLRFHAVVCDKQEILKQVQQRNVSDPEYWYSPNELYDSLVRSLFGKFHRLASRYRVYVARRGNSDRNEALRTAIEHAERDFVSKFGFGRGLAEDWKIEVTVPERHEPLQAVDYYLWALQRCYEPRRHEKSGEEIRDDRFLKLLWPQVGEVHDLHFGPAYGTFFTRQHPFSVEERFGGDGRKKKRP